MKRILILTGMALSLMHCSQGSVSDSAGNQDATDNRTAHSDSDQVVITEIAGTTGGSQLSQYQKSTFSNLIYWHQTQGKMLLDYNFFPAGTDFDSQAKVARIPCEYRLALETGAAVSLSAPAEDSDCGQDMVINLSEAAFTVDGLVFSFQDRLSVFEDFEFDISTVGFVDTASGDILSPDSPDANLEDVNDLILDRRTS